MGFFDKPAQPTPPPPPPTDQPEWHGPANGMLAGLSTQRVVLFHTGDAHLMVDRIQAYPNGIHFTVVLRLRKAEEFDDPPWELHRRRRPAPPVDEILRLGFLFSDGTKWTNLDRPRPFRGEDPQPPVIALRSGGGGNHMLRATYWMWPLPPNGPLEVFVEWPARGVEERSVVLDATELRQRAAEAVQLWP
jgi:hypothetical protein